MMTLDAEHTLLQRIGLGLLGLVLLACAAIGLSGCSVAMSDRGMVYTEEGLRAASRMWDSEYEAKLEACAAKYPAGSAGAETCFGPTYDADAAVAPAVYAAVMVLRRYWDARARGEAPDWATVLREVQAIVASLPPEVRAYFDRVKGIPK